MAERTEAGGGISTALDEAAVEAAARTLKQAGVEAVVVGFVNAYRNPLHEEQAAAILRQHFTHVTRSTAVLNEIREFERFSVAAINGYVMPVMASYVGRLTRAVRGAYPAAGFYTVASDGGLLSTAMAVAQPVRTVLSGPAAGLAAAMHLARATGIANLITYDMGGTSTDVALIADGAMPLKRETLLRRAGHPPAVVGHPHGQRGRRAWPGGLRQGRHPSDPPWPGGDRGDVGHDIPANRLDAVGGRARRAATPARDPWCMTCCLLALAACGTGI